MFDTIKRYKTTLLVLFLIAGAFWGYQNFFVGTSPNDLLLRDSTGEDGTALGQEIVQILGELKAIDFNTAFLSDETFTGLTDFSQEIDPEPVGRTNPFDLIGIGIDIGGVLAEPTSIVDTITKSVPEVLDIPTNSDTSKDEGSMLDTDTATDTTNESSEAGTEDTSMEATSSAEEGSADSSGGTASTTENE